MIVSEMTRLLTGCVGVSDLGGGSYEVILSDGSRRGATADEIAAATAAAARAAIRPVSARQMLVALDESGLLDGIEAYVASQPRVVQITWARSQEFQRDNPLLNAGAAAFGLTDEQVDGLFALAASK